MSKPDKVKFFATIQRKFEAGHRIPKAVYKPCRRFHGHSYQIQVRFEIECPSFVLETVGYPYDFNELKEMVDKCLPDHKFLIYKDDVFADALKGVFKDEFRSNFIEMDSPPSAENIVDFIAKKIKTSMKRRGYKYIRRFAITLKEGLGSGEVMRVYELDFPNYGDNQ